MKFLARAFLLILAVAIHAPPLSAEEVPQEIDGYRLGPGDRMKITVYGHSDVSGQFIIDGSGNISYPLLGRVQAQGRTATDVQEHLRAELDRQFIVDPKVSVEVLKYRPFYIYGEVQKAGSYPYVTGLTIRRAVAIAGGFTRRARHARMRVVREAEEGAATIEVKLDGAVLPGDIVEVPRRLF